MAVDFLPICDVLFNVISTASYFCDIVFDILTIYTFYIKGNTIWFAIGAITIVASLISCQLLSVKWYFVKNKSPSNYKKFSIVLIHIFQSGILWRYSKLFVPVELQSVKHDVRDLCVLRIMHGFIEAIPLLLIQLYLIFLVPKEEINNLFLVSSLLSLFNVCWALASFNKNMRRHNVHRLVLTWLGVIFQFVWRLGTVSSRVVSLMIYATVYKYWVFLVIVLHWISMFLWLIFPKNSFQGEQMSKLKKVVLSILVSYVYIFSYVNLEESSPRVKIFTFYTTMLLENALLTLIWCLDKKPTAWDKSQVSTFVFVSFVFGILFMIIYYKFFHVRKLKYAVSDGRGDVESSKVNGVDAKGGKTERYSKEHDCNGYDCKHQGRCPKRDVHVPGVFNCALNPALRKKKKKPSSFIPPPSSNGKSARPFWKEPLPPGPDCADIRSVTSRTDIQMKLREKKEKQEMELRKIENEIRQGKFEKPLDGAYDDMDRVAPIPVLKSRPFLELDLELLDDLNNDSSNQTKFYDKFNKLASSSYIKRTPIISNYKLNNKYRQVEPSSDLESNLSDLSIQEYNKTIYYNTKNSTLKNRHSTNSSDGDQGDVDSGEDIETKRKIGHIKNVNYRQSPNHMENIRSYRRNFTSPPPVHETKL